jgi:predicted enzyme related to lactoylglutathione lyase
MPLEGETHMYFEIQADDPARAIGFYSNVFGWTFIEEKDIGIEYWRIEADMEDGGLLRRPEKAPPKGSGTNAFVCSIEVEDFDSTADKILRLGGTVALAKFAVPGRCWQGYFLDTEGNTFGMYQVDENAGA